MKRVRATPDAVYAFVAAVTIVTAVLFIPAHRFYFRGSAFEEVLARLPATLILVAVSAIAALLAAGLCTWLRGRSRSAWIGMALSGLLVAAACLPTYWAAMMAQLELAVKQVPLFGFRIQLPSAGLANSDNFSLRDSAVHLVIPAGVLALVQAGAYLDCMRRGASARAFFTVFAVLLPAILSADVLVEAIFAWPGESRALFHATSLSRIFAMLIVEAALVLLVRGVAQVLDTSDDRAIDVLEPL